LIASFILPEDPFPLPWPLAYIRRCRRQRAGYFRLLDSFELDVDGCNGYICDTAPEATPTITRVMKILVTAPRLPFE
jgi:hypothetical protein